MVTFEQFYNSTLPQMIGVINAQSNQIIFQQYLIYCLFGIWIVVGIGLILRKYLRIERRKR